MTVARDPRHGPPRDLLGRELTSDEAAVLEVYERLKQLAARDDLPPSVSANVRHALSYVHNAVNDLALAYEHLLDHGA